MTLPLRTAWPLLGPLSILVACADTGKLPFQDDALLRGERADVPPPGGVGGGSGGTTPGDEICWRLTTLEACDDCCIGRYPSEADQWSSFGDQCACGSCYSACGDAVCIQQDYSQLTTTCMDCVIPCADLQCAASGCSGYSACSDPCLDLPSTGGAGGTLGMGGTAGLGGAEGTGGSGWTQVDAVATCSRVCDVATSQGCPTTATCASDCATDLAGACQTAMIEVLHCHDTQGVVCSWGLGGGNGIDPSPCATQHSAAETCGIDPF